MKRGIMRKKWIILVLILLVVAVIIGLKTCRKTTAPGGEMKPDNADTYTVSFGNIDSRIEITGEVQPQTIVSQKSRVSGKVVKFYADENDYVKLGDIIADIEQALNK